MVYMVIPCKSSCKSLVCLVVPGVLAAFSLHISFVNSVCFSENFPVKPVKWFNFLAESAGGGGGIVLNFREFP